MGRQRLGPDGLQLHAFRRCLLWAVRSAGLLGIGHMESREDCLREAAECDRLAQLANTQASRALMALAAFQWRKLAEKGSRAAKAPLAIGAGCGADELARR